MFFEKSCTKCGGATSSRQFFKKSKFIFIVCPSGGLKKILTLRCWPLAFASYKTFLKDKKRSGTSFLGSFSKWFLV